jgi:nitrous oxidase accessory protein NosD
MWRIFLFLIGGALAATVFGATIPVPSAGVRTISKAMIKARDGDTVLVSDGVYRERVLVTYGVVLTSRSPHKAIIDANGRGIAVTMGRNTVLNGFVVRNATVGVYSDNVGTAIRNCVVVRNWEAGIVCVNLLPVIEDNVIAYNRGTGLHLVQVQGLSGAVNHNTVAYNLGSGLILVRAEESRIENNCVALNKRYGIVVDKAGPGTAIRSNNFFENQLQTKVMPSDNFSFNPAFVDWRALDFSSDPKIPPAHKGLDDQAIGARRPDHE